MTEPAALTQEQLESALVMLRKQGVKFYTDVAGGGFTVEFFPPQPVETPPQKKAPEEDDLCPCGHHLGREHMNGFCIHNCTTCNPEAAAELSRPQAK